MGFEKPVGSKKQYIFGINGRRTICEVLRDINDQFQDDSEEHKQARDLVVNSMLLSKKMIGILAQFKKDAGGNINEWLGTISEEFFDINSAKYLEMAHTIRGKPGYKVGGKFN